MTYELTPIAKEFSTYLSRYKKNPITRDGVDEFFMTRTPKDYPFSKSDIYHTIGPGEEGRIDLLAYRYYGSTLLWWVIAEANDMKNPLIETVSGNVLRIPSMEFVFGTLLVK